MGIEKMKKKKMLAIAATMEKANNALLGGGHKNLQGLSEMLVQCQDVAIQIGNSLEDMGEQYAPVVHLLEDYCENIFQMSESLTDENTCRKLAKRVQMQLTDLQNRIRNEVPDDKKEVVFLPYKASMWDSLESVWKATASDENTDAYVIPIPYYDKNPDGSFREEHYEGDLYPDYVPVTKYDQYDFAGRRPDIIYIHNAYDAANYITSVHPFFYSENLKKYTDKLVYIPYFVLGEIDPENREAIKSVEHFWMIPGVFQADKVIVQSEDMRRIYINSLTEKMMEGSDGQNEKEIRKYWENKIDGSGSPKFDKILNRKRGNIKIPETWTKIINKDSGEQKKIILYNTSVASFLTHGEDLIRKIQRVFQVFKEQREDVALWWRPHPLTEATLTSMRPKLYEEYRRLVEQYREAGWGIYDDSPDLERALTVSDGYYGDSSSLVELCRKAGIPVLIQNVDV